MYTQILLAAWRGERAATSSLIEVGLAERDAAGARAGR